MVQVMISTLRENIPDPFFIVSLLRAERKIVKYINREGLPYIYSVSRIRKIFLVQRGCSPTVDEKRICFYVCNNGDGRYPGKETKDTDDDLFVSWWNLE